MKAPQITTRHTATNNPHLPYGLNKMKSINNQRNLYQGIFKHSSFAIISTTINGIITSFNPAAEKMLGYKEKNLIGKKGSEIFHDPKEVIARAIELSEELNEPLLPGFDVFIAKSRKGLKNQHEWTYIHKDGSRFPVMLGISAIYNDDDVIEGYLGIAADISKQYHTQQDLILARDQLTKAAEVADLGIWSWIPSNNELKWNDRMYAMYQQPLSLRDIGLTFEHWRSRVHPNDVKKTVGALKRAVEGHGVYNPIFRILLPDGQVRFIQAGAQVERDSNGKTMRVIGFNLDVTAQYENESLLRQAKEKSDAASIAKSDFLANMSHELRTPLNAIIGLSELLQMTPLEQSQSGYVKNILVSSQLLLGIVNDILDFSKIEAGKFILDVHPMKLEKLFDEILSLMSIHISNKNIEIILDLDPNVPQWIMGDALRLQQILVNLFSNALKFTNQGEITIRVKKIREQKEQVTIKFSIVDTGIGISKEQQGIIFDNFSQAETSTTRRFGGTGLGLSISKKLVDMMGGELLVKSTPGKGSIFYFQIDFNLVKHQKKNLFSQQDDSMPNTNNSLAGLSLLLIEDNPTNQIVAHDLLTHAGALVTVVDNAPAGIKAVLEANPLFNVVLMDIQMPGMDGYEAARDIRKQYDEKQLPIIALSANALSEDRNKAIASRMNAFVSKPFKIHELVSTILEVTAGKSTKKVRGSRIKKTDTKAVLDSAEALSRFGNNQSVYYLALQEFMVDAAVQIKKISKTLDVDISQTMQALHALKGLASTVGASALASIASNIYQLLHEGKRPTDKVWKNRLTILRVACKQAINRAQHLLIEAKGRKKIPKMTRLTKTVLPQALLIKLLHCLETHNMEAVTIYKVLNQSNHIASSKSWLDLGVAIEQLDFEKAEIYCQLLFQQNF